MWSHFDNPTQNIHIGIDRKFTQTRHWELFILQFHNYTRRFWSNKSVLQKFFGTFSAQDLGVAKTIAMAIAVATVMAVAMAVAAGTPPLTSPVWVTADTAKPAELQQPTHPPILQEPDNTNQTSPGPCPATSQPCQGQVAAGQPWWCKATSTHPRTHLASARQCRGDEAGGSRSPALRWFPIRERQRLPHPWAGPRLGSTRLDEIGSWRHRPWAGPLPVSTCPLVHRGYGCDGGGGFLVLRHILRAMAEGLLCYSGPVPGSSE